ncbi:MAG: hypothetical protein OSJ58_17400 [Dysosmobacter sp.]|nr:hypothetical protein [Dysosmobacter sp.]
MRWPVLNMLAKLKVGSWLCSSYLRICQRRKSRTFTQYAQAERYLAKHGFKAD